MGYKTWYNLTITGAKDEQEEADIIADLRETHEEAKCAFDDEGYGQTDLQWSNDDGDMAEFSKKYPHVLFCLTAKGDADDDMWEGYYQDGKYQLCHAEIVYPPYDPAKMVAYEVEAN